MQLVEVMVAASVFTAAAGGSLQLFAQAASSSQQSELRQQQLERVELDRLQLQAHWRRQLQGEASCSVNPEQLQAMAAQLQPPPQVQREVLPGEQAEELRVRWRIAGHMSVVRERWVTAAGLGLCPATVSPELE
jgi:type II secretory pathway component PulJ